MSFEFECCKMRSEGNARLTTLVKHYKKYNPLWDEQILLAGVVNCLIKNNFKVSKKEIYYAFKKNYNRDFHGDTQSYCKWLYSLAQPSKKIAYDSITKGKGRVCMDVLEINKRLGISACRDKLEATK